MSDLFGLSISLGSVSNLEADMVEALDAPFTEACQAARGAAALHTDETGWAERYKLAWLWALATTSATIFLVRKSRGAEVAKELLGPSSDGIVVTDRWSGYSWLPTGRRQLCWAHLIRDFRKLSECAEPLAGLGNSLLDCARRLFDWWHRVRDGTLRRSTFRNYVGRLRSEVRTYLAAGSGCAHRKAAALCRGILRFEPAMWTFARIPGVEPTNNLVERALRPVVLWRKGSYGSCTTIGHAFVERMLTTVATLRQHGRNVLEFLQEACVSALRKATAPSLIPAHAPHVGA
jgi:transposase